MPDKKRLKKLEDARKKHVAYMKSRTPKTDAERKAQVGKLKALDSAIIKEKDELGIPQSKTSSGEPFITTREGASKHTRPVSKKAMEKSEKINVENRMKGAAALNYKAPMPDEYNQVPMSNKTIDRLNNKK